MALRLDDKKALVAEVAEVAQTAHSVVAAEYRGLPVAKLTELRAKARASRVYMRVVKNTLARRAIAGTQFECVGDKLKGPLILAFSQDDPGAAARLIKGFAKDNDKLVPTLVSLGGTVLRARTSSASRACRRRSRRSRNCSACSRPRSASSCARSRSRTAKLVRTIAAVKDQKQAALRKPSRHRIRVSSKHFLEHMQMAATKEEILERDFQHDRHGSRRTRRR